MLRLLLMLLLLALASVYAFRRGGKPERQVALILWGMVAFDQLYHLILRGEGIYAAVDLFHAFNDLWALAAVLFVALTANRFWTLWVASLQIIAALSHFLRLIESEMLTIVYAVIIRFPFWLQIVCLIWGTWNYDRRKRREVAPIT